MKALHYDQAEAGGYLQLDEEEEEEEEIAEGKEYEDYKKKSFFLAEGPESAPKEIRQATPESYLHSVAFEIPSLMVSCTPHYTTSGPIMRPLTL